MRRTRRLASSATVVIAFAVALQSKASEQGTGIIYGSDHAFTVTAPAGWVLDNQSGASQGLWAVFYPTGSSWRESNVVMYINTASKAGDPTREGLIAGDIQRQRKESPGLKVTPGELLALRDGTKVPVNHFRGDRWGNYEAIAYIDAPTVWIMVVLTSRDEAAYKAALPSFASLVKSYGFLATEVEIEK